MFEHLFETRMIIQYCFWFVVCFGIFSLLAQLFPNIKGQRVFRPGVRLDLIYWFLSPLIYIQIGGWILVGLSFLFFLDAIESRQFAVQGFGLFVDLPVALQFVISLLFMNIGEYWSHRWFHGKLLWKTHSIHHAPKELDWLSGVRIHPLNMLVHSIFSGALVFALGFAPIVFIMRFPFDILYAAMVHANLNWTFGPLRFVLASPVFHRFHHTSAKEGLDKNFAPIFSFIDLMFGTYYMPKGEFPKVFGVAEAVPETFTGQLMYPFRKNT